LAQQIGELKNEIFKLFSEKDRFIAKKINNEIE